MQSPSEDLGIHGESNSQNESSLGSVRVHSLTFFCTFGSMRCDSRASLLAHNFARLCFGRGPKARVVTWNIDVWVGTKKLIPLCCLSSHLFNISWSFISTFSLCLPYFNTKYEVVNYGIKKILGLFHIKKFLIKFVS